MLLAGDIGGTKTALGVMVVANFALGLFSERVINLAEKWSGALTVSGHVTNMR